MSSLARRCIGLYRRASREKPGEEVVFEICWNTVPLLEGQMGLVSRYVGTQFHC